jgi:O-antigen/teichoic acid export membrane protein
MVRAAGFSAGLKVAAALLAFAASLFYARALGPHGYGLFGYVVACTSLISIPVSLGFPQYLVREGARAPESLQALRRYADIRVLCAGSAAAVLLACAAFIPQAAGARWLFVIAAPLPLLGNLGVIRQSLLQAQGLIAHSQWPQLLLAPALAVILMAGLWAWRGAITPVALMTATVLAAGVALSVNAWQLGRNVPRQSVAPPAGIRLRAALPFMWLGAMYLLVSRTDLIMLGTLRGAHEAGVYFVASRAAELLVLIGMAATATAAPKIATLCKQGDTGTLQRLLSAMGRRTLFLTIPPAVLMVLLASPLLSVLYGSSYAEGARALQLLTVAQLLAVMGGPAGTLLNMSGHEGEHLRGIAAGAIVNVALNALLIPHYGIEGAAMSTCIGILLSRAIILIAVRQHLKIRSSALGI